MKTELKVSTTSCGLCGKAHSGFRLKLDSKNVHYVICGAGKTAKRVNVVFRDPKSKNPFQPGKWTQDR
jgi:hypothetical protein